MKVLITLLVCFGTIIPAHAVLHPVIIDPTITGCKASDDDGPCSLLVTYKGSTVLADVAAAEPPNPVDPDDLALVAIGVHCNHGNALLGVPFSGCDFREGNEHAPVVANCTLKSVSSWELTASSTCNLRVSTWGIHQGAGPGGECVLFVQARNGQASGWARSIHGTVAPDVVANSGNAFCQKPLPPDVTCAVLLPDSIDHGTISPNSQNTASIEGDIDCGNKPVITFAGGRRITLAPGVTTELTAHVLGGGRVKITSDLIAVNGEAGYHSAATVILISPY